MRTLPALVAAALLAAALLSACAEPAKPVSREATDFALIEIHLQG